MPVQSCEKKLCLVFSLTFEGCIKSAFGSKENREVKKGAMFLAINMCKGAFYRKSILVLGTPNN